MTVGPFNEDEDAIPPDEVMKEGTTCSSSAMDESMGSTQDVLSHGPASAAVVEGVQRHGSGSIESLSTGVSDRRPMPAETEPDAEALPQIPSTANVRLVADHREPSTGSDTYEPPEPGPAADGFKTVTTPPFSPAPPGTVDLSNVNRHSASPAQDVEALTLHTQDSVAPMALETVKARLKTVVWFILTVLIQYVG